MMKIEFEDLLGIPFKLHGRDKKGYDCYGLVLEIAKRTNHKMPDLYYDYGVNNEKSLDENTHNIIYASALKKIENAEYGDVIFFYDRKGRTQHIGIKLNGDDFLHCDCNGVHVSKLSKEHRSWSAYRWQN